MVPSPCGLHQKHPLAKRQIGFKRLKARHGLYVCDYMDLWMLGLIKPGDPPKFEKKLKGLKIGSAKDHHETQTKKLTPTVEGGVTFWFGFVVTFDTDSSQEVLGSSTLEVNNLIISILRRPGPTSVGELLHRSSTPKNVAPRCEGALQPLAWS